MSAASVAGTAAVTAATPAVAAGAAGKEGGLVGKRLSGVWEGRGHRQGLLLLLLLFSEAMRMELRREPVA